MTLAMLLADHLLNFTDKLYLWLMSCLVLLFVLLSTLIDSPRHVAEMHVPR